jgi:hypothetical protein
MTIIKTLFRKLGIWLFLLTTRPREVERKLRAIGYSRREAIPVTNDFLGILRMLLNDSFNL